MSNISEQPVNADLGLTFDETGIIKQIQGGQTVLFGALIGRFQDRLYNLAYRLTGNGEDAADLAQETFTRALRGIHQFRGHCRFYTWLVRILINITNDWKSKAKQERELRIGMQSVLERSQASDLLEAQDPQARAQGREMVEMLWQAIDALPGQYRQVLILRDLEQLSYEEITQILKLTEGTVKSRIFRARESLRERLAPLLGSKSGNEA